MAGEVDGGWQLFAVVGGSFQKAESCFGLETMANNRQPPQTMANSS
jgi:hypothetical protein